MKTSNKILSCALLLVFVSLIGYDFLLKNAYFSGKFQDPFHDFVTLKFRDFNAVDVISSTAANVKFVQGQFSVRIDSNALEYTRVAQTGSRLQVNVVFKHTYLSGPNPYVLVISCPTLAEVTANATYLAGNVRVTDTIVRNDWRMRQVSIDGFQQDSLTIRQDFGSTVILSNNHIHTLKAVAGPGAGAGSKLVILKSNYFQNVAISALNNSQLVLNDAVIHNLNYHLADSAKLVLTGAAQNLLNHSNSSKK